jgi:hypothetical protein
MPQATQSLPLRHQLAPHRLLAVSALLALLATVAVVLVLTMDGPTKVSGAAGQSAHSALRSDGGPEESATAASVGRRPGARPDENRIAASIGSADKPAPKVGEAKVSPSIRHN